MQLCKFTHSVQQGPGCQQFLLYSWQRHYMWRYRESGFSLSNSVDLWRFEYSIFKLQNDIPPVELLHFCPSEITNYFSLKSLFSVDFWQVYRTICWQVVWQCYSGFVEGVLTDMEHNRLVYFDYNCLLSSTKWFYNINGYYICIYQHCI